MENCPELLRRHGWMLPAKGMHPLAQEALDASKRIYVGVNKTRLLPSKWLEQEGGGRVLLKMENEQATGSFKARGAVNKVFSLSPAEVEGGIVASSTGNHALAVLHACSCLADARAGPPPGAPLIFLPHTASDAKAAKLEALGARLVRVGDDCMEAETAGRAEAERLGAVYISPYNDVAVAGGQGTIAVELLAELPRLDAVFVPVGGGGMISGIAAVLKAAAPGARVVGCQPAASDVMRRSVAAGRVLDLPSLPTLSDGTAGGVEEGALTLESCAALVDEWVTASEPEIAAAMLALRDRDGVRAEGAAAVAAACFVQQRARWAGRTVVVVVCGGNVGDAAFAEAERLVGM